MMWIDIASIVFVCVTANHLGLIRAIEGVIRYRLTIVGCTKCLTFWVTLVYLFGRTEEHTEAVLAIAFLASYAAIWLELLEGSIDVLYTKIYETIYPKTDDDTDSTDADGGDSAGPVSEL